MRRHKNHPFRGRFPPHPGELLNEVVLRHHDLSTEDVAKALDVDPATLSDFMVGKTSLTADLAVRLACWLPSVPTVRWLEAQLVYDYAQLPRLEAEITPTVTPFPLEVDVDLPTRVPCVLCPTRE